MDFAFGYYIMFFRVRMVIYGAKNLTMQLTHNDCGGTADSGKIRTTTMATDGSQAAHMFFLRCEFWSQ